jgi:hypothetical protein
MADDNEPAVAKHRYRCSPITAQRFGMHAFVASAITTRTPKLMGQDVLELLQACRGFATLEGHAKQRFEEWYGRQRQVRGRWRAALAALRHGARSLGEIAIARRGQSANPWLYQECLAALTREGFLVSERELDRRLRTSPSPSPLRISTLAIPTSNRPTELLRCVSSFATALARHGRRPRLLVSDGSADTACLVPLRHASTRCGLELDRIGAEDRESFSSRLAAEIGVPATHVSFAFVGASGHQSSAGANRNAILIATMDEAILSVDDDTLCAPAPMLPVQTGSALDSRVAVRTVRLFAERSRAIQSLPEADADVLALHEAALGRALSCAATETQSVDFSRADDCAVEDIWLGRGRVLATATGLRGRSGLRWPVRYVEPDLRWQRDIGRDSATYRAAVESQSMSAAVERLTLSNRSFLSTMFFGLDGSVLLPPFMPVFRSQDVLFGEMLRCCHHDAYIGHLPWTLVHDPLAERRVPLEELACHTRLEFNVYLARLLRAIDLASVRDPAERLSVIGRYLQDLARMPVTGCAEVLQDVYLQVQVERLRRFELSSESAEGFPELWLSQARNHLSALRRAVLDHHSAVPIEFADIGDAAWSEVQRMIGAFGRLLSIWVDVLAGARRLAARGEGLVPVRQG